MKGNLCDKIKCVRFESMINKFNHSSENVIKAEYSLEALVFIIKNVQELKDPCIKLYSPSQNNAE
jgi:hypothetical protein